MGKKVWYVYENLNDAADRIVVSGDKTVASIYRRISGPFPSKREAEKAAR